MGRYAHPVNQSKKKPCSHSFKFKCNIRHKTHWALSSYHTSIHFMHMFTYMDRMNLYSLSWWRTFLFHDDVFLIRNSHVALVVLIANAFPCPMRYTNERMKKKIPYIRTKRIWTNEVTERYGFWTEIAFHKLWIERAECFLYHGNPNYFCTHFTSVVFSFIWSKMNATTKHANLNNQTHIHIYSMLLLSIQIAEVNERMHLDYFSCKRSHKIMIHTLMAQIYE